MNQIPSNSNQSTALEDSMGKENGNTQVLLPRTLSQQIKKNLRQLGDDTGAEYSLSHFVVRVLEKHWSSDLEQLRKGLEKLNQIK